MLQEALAPARRRLMFDAAKWLDEAAGLGVLVTLGPDNKLDINIARATGDWSPLLRHLMPSIGPYVAPITAALRARQSA